MHVSVSGNGNTVKCETEAVHTVHKGSSEDSDSLLQATINRLWRSFNLFAAEFGQKYGYIKCKWLKQYYCSFYSSPFVH